jgi:Tat protein translocase TatB subunit
MDIFGIGFPELVFIFIIALMVFGPRRLPEIAGKAGKFVRDLRNMSQGFLAEWQREITVATRLEELQQVRQELEETKRALTQTGAELNTSAATIGQTISSAAKLPKTDTAASPPKATEQTPPAEATLATPVAPSPEVADTSTELATVVSPATAEAEKNGNSTRTVAASIPPTEVAE